MSIFFVDSILLKKVLHGKTLTIGSIMRGSNNDVSGNPLLQVLDIKKINSNPEHFRVIVSDGLHFQQSVLTEQLNSLITSNQIKVLSIIQLHKFKCYSYYSQSRLRKEQVFFIEKITILDLIDCKEVIGYPVAYNNPVSSK